MTYHDNLQPFFYMITTLATAATRIQAPNFQVTDDT